jgi:hypothetical protein
MKSALRKCTDRPWSTVTTVQPSASTRVSGLPALTKGSMAAMAGVILASESPSSRWDRSSALADFMKRWPIPCPE